MLLSTSLAHCEAAYKRAGVHTISSRHRGFSGPTSEIAARASEDGHDVVSRNEADTATNISMVAMPIASLRRKLRQVGEGLPTRRTMYFATVAWLILMPSFKRLAVDAGRTPQWVGAVHLPDQITNFAIYWRPSRP